MNQIQVAPVIHVAELIEETSFHAQEAIRKIIPEVMTKFFETLPHKFCIIPINFDGIDQISRDAALAMSMLIAGVTSTRTDAVVVLEGIQEEQGAGALLNLTFRENGLVVVAITKRGEPLLFGAAETIILPSRVWEFLVSQQQWVETTVIARETHLNLKQTRTALEVLSRRNLIFVDRSSPKRIICRAVGLKESPSE